MERLFTRTLVFVGALVASLALGATAASAATRFAASAGSGASCIQADPCSIATAVNGGPGDEVILLPGNYSISATLNVLNPTSIHGLDGAPRPTITSTSAFSAIEVTAANAVIRHVEIEAPGDGVTGSGVALEAGGQMLEDVVVDATSNGCSPASTSGTITIRNSICRGDAVGVGVACVGCNETVVLRNVTAIGGTNGVAFNSSFGSPSTYTVNAFNTIARHTGGSGADVAAIAHTTNSSTVINLDHSNYATRSEVHDCTTAPCTATVTDPSTNSNQTTAPMFVFELGGDFHQAPDSPTVNAGINDGSNGSADIDGQDRTIDTTTDIGADELGLPTTTALACFPTALTLPGMSTCTATETDSTASPVAPTGPVAFESDASGTFSSSTCTLAPSGPTGQASCAVTYTPDLAGTHGLTAVSGQDTTHEGSKGATSLSATAPATPTPVPPAVKKKKCKKKHKRAAAAKKKCKKHKK